MYTGKAGLAMFDSIDTMAEQFIKGIGTALPEVRTSAVQQGGAVQSSVVSYEKRRSETAIIDKRQALRSSLTFITGPSVAVIDGVLLPSGPNTLLAYLALGVIFDYSFSGPFSLLAILQPAVAFDTPGSSGLDPEASYTSRPYLDIPLRFGPEYTVFGYNGDLSFAFLGEGRFMQAWFDGSTGKVYEGSWLFGLGLETSARLYLQSRVSERPTYIFIGFSWFLVGMQTDFDLTRPRITPLEVALSLGYGFRL
jgi:hypothetical protein